MSVTPEPKDKLGTMVRQRVATVVRRAVVVNGPEDVGLKWDAVNWRSAEDDVRSLRQRIFAASQVGDLKRVRNLQKLMFRSRSNTLVTHPRCPVVHDLLLSCFVLLERSLVARSGSDY